MKGGKELSEKDKLVGIVIMSVLTVIAAITCGFIVNRPPDSVPEIEILEIIDAREDNTSAAVTEGAPEVSAAEEQTVPAQTSKAESRADRLININTASAEQLTELNGIGEKTAAAIVEYREITPFERIEDIMNVNGIGEKKFENIKDLICV